MPKIDIFWLKIKVGKRAYVAGKRESIPLGPSRVPHPLERL